MLQSKVGTQLRLGLMIEDRLFIRNADGHAKGANVMNASDDSDDSAQHRWFCLRNLHATGELVERSYNNHFELDESV